MIKIAVCDDDYAFSENVRNAILNLKIAREKEIAADIFLTPESAEEAVLTEKYNIILMDVDLENQIKKMRQDIPVYIYPKALAVYIPVYDGCNLGKRRRQQFGFLHKPLDVRELEALLKNAFEMLAFTENKLEIIHHGACSYIRLHDVQYVFSSGFKNTIVSDFQKEPLYKRLDVLEMEMNSLYPYFIRANKQYLVNFFHIRKFNQEDILIMDNGDDISVSESYRDEFLKKYSGILFDDVSL